MHVGVPSWPGDSGCARRAARIGATAVRPMDGDM
jgi:hypothetical protein